MNEQEARQEFRASVIATILARPYAAADRLSARMLARAIVDRIQLELGEDAATFARPSMAGGIAITVALAIGVGAVDKVRGQLAEIARNGDVVEQLLVCTTGAHVATPASIGGKLCTVVLLPRQVE